jgi:hypothetical protein
MRLGYIGSCQARQIVSVEENWHWCCSTVSSDGLDRNLHQAWRFVESDI